MGSYLKIICTLFMCGLPIYAVAEEVVPLPPPPMTTVTAVSSPPTTVMPITTSSPTVAPVTSAPPTTPTAVVPMASPPTTSATTTSVTTTTTAPSSVPPPPNAQMSPNDFQQWLQTTSPNAMASPSGAPMPSGPPIGIGTSTTNMTSATTTTTTIKRRRGRPPFNQPPLTYEQGQQAMLRSVPPEPRLPDPDADAAFNTMMQQNMPLSPQQVVKLHQQVDVAQRAAAVPPNIPPKPVSTTLMINLAPGTTPPAVRLAQGYVSSLVFVDSTGAPWPIAAFDIGTPKALNIQWDGKSNILLLQAVAPYSYGDIVVRLVGLPTPITLELVSGQRVVDYRIDIHVSGIGPNTKEVPMGTTLPNSANQLLLNVLDGIAPAGSKALVVLGADAQAWLLADKVYLRTRLTLLSPGWVGKMVSPDGMQAYEIPKTSSVLVSRYGEPVELRIEGF